MVAQVVVMIVGVYIGLGALFAAAFAFRGAGAIDPVAREATFGFRLLIIPGAAALWPLLLLRWVRCRKGAV